MPAFAALVSCGRLFQWEFAVNNDPELSRIDEAADLRQSLSIRTNLGHHGTHAVLERGGRIRRWHCDSDQCPAALTQYLPRSVAGFSAHGIDNEVDIRELL